MSGDELSVKTAQVVLAVLNDHHSYGQHVNAEASTEEWTCWEAVCACGEPLTDATNGPFFDRMLTAHQAQVVAAALRTPPDEGSRRG